MAERKKRGGLYPSVQKNREIQYRLGMDDYNDEVLREHLHPAYPEMWTETGRWNDVWSHDRLWS